jgi:hypothetical protein
MATPAKKVATEAPKDIKSSRTVIADQELAMHAYEIRVLNSNLSSRAFVQMLGLTDAAAICSAKRIANGRSVEVWRDLDCIYRSRLDADAMKTGA